MKNRLLNSLPAWGISLGAALLLILVLFAVGACTESWWGISAIMYLSPLVRAGLLIIAAAALIMSLRGFFSRLSMPKWFRGKAWITLSILTAGLFALREAFPLLGDGWLLAGLSEEYISIFPIWVSDRPWILGLSLVAVLHRLTGFSGQAIYQLFSVFSGIAIVMLLSWFARLQNFSFRQSLILGLPFFSSGGLALFAGYVENYPTLIVLWVAMILYALASVQNQRVPFWPLFIAVPFLFFWHYMSLILFPAIAFAGFLRVRKTAISPRSFLFFLMGLSGVILLLYVFTPLSLGIRLFLPLSPGNAADGYSLVSGHHIVDFVWELLLAAPLAFLFLAAAWILRPKLVLNSEFQVLALTAFLGIAAAFVFDPELGMARDWDLLATMLLPLNLLAGYAIAMAEPKTAFYRRIVGASLVSFFVIALPFVLVNHQSDASEQRYRDLLSTHPERSAYGWEILASFMEDKGDSQARLTCLENAARVSPNQRYFESIGKLAESLGQLERAHRAVEKLAGANPRHYKEANDYFILFYRFGFLEEAERMLPFLRMSIPPGETMDKYYRTLARLRGDTTRSTFRP